MQIIELSMKFLEAEVENCPAVPFPWDRVRIKVPISDAGAVAKSRDMFEGKFPAHMVDEFIEHLGKSTVTIEVDGDIIRHKIDGSMELKCTRDGKVLFDKLNVGEKAALGIVNIVNKVAWTFFKPKELTPEPRTRKGLGGKRRQTGELRYKTVGNHSYMYHKSENPREYTRRTDAWDVRPYVRRYKSGLTITVKGHTRGQGTPKDKPYKI